MQLCQMKSQLQQSICLHTMIANKLCDVREASGIHPPLVAVWGSQWAPLLSLMQIEFPHCASGSLPGLEQTLGGGGGVEPKRKLLMLCTSTFMQHATTSIFNLHQRNHEMTNMHPTTEIILCT